jgi:hypothetical protein
MPFSMMALLTKPLVSELLSMWKVAAEPAAYLATIIAAGFSVLMKPPEHGGLIEHGQLSEILWPTSSIISLLL